MFALIIANAFSPTEASGADIGLVQPAGNNLRPDRIIENTPIDDETRCLRCNDAIDAVEYLTGCRILTRADDQGNDFAGVKGNTPFSPAR